MTDHLTKLREMREVALAGGGPERVADQKAKGKGTARERLSFLLDEGSFQEIGALATHDCTDFGMAEKRFPGDGVVCGFGKINGRRVAVFAHDFTVLGGSFSAVQSQKICRLQDLALESGIPLIGLNDSGGARIQEGVRSLADRPDRGDGRRRRRPRPASAERLAAGTRRPSRSASSRSTARRS